MFRSSFQQLKKNLEPFFIRIKKLDLEKYMNLPKIVEKEIMVGMDSEQRNIYENILDTYVPMFTRNNSASIRDILNRARLIRLRQAASNPKLLLHSLQNSLESDNFDEGLDLNSNFVEESENFLSDSEIFTQLKQYSDTTIPNKFKETLNLLKNEIFARNEKVIIWTIFIQNAKQLIDYLTEHEIRAKLLIGETPLDERVTIIKKFNNPLNMDFSVVVANPFSVSESISLHMGCRNAIYFERDYNCAMFIQSRDRIHRVGLTKDQKPNYYYLISNDSIDEVIDNRLKEKVERMEKLINDDIPLFSRVDDTDETEIVKGVLKQHEDSQ